MFFKDWELRVLEYSWSIQPSGANCKEVLSHLQQTMGEPISRASIINFLNSMVDEGAVEYTEITGKGGHRRIYSAKYDEAGSKRYMAKKIISKLLETWPETTREAIEAIKGEQGKEKPGGC